jgi:hypothetical protein
MNREFHLTFLLRDRDDAPSYTASQDIQGRIVAKRKEESEAFLVGCESLQCEISLKDRGSATIPRDSKLLYKKREREFLMFASLSDNSGNILKQIAKREAPAEGCPERENIDERTKHALEARISTATGNGCSDKDILLARLLKQKCVIGRQEDHEERGILGFCNALELIREFLFQTKGKDITVVCKQRRAWFVDGKVKFWKRSCKFLGPIGEETLAFCSLEQVPLPGDVVFEGCLDGRESARIRR